MLRVSIDTTPPLITGVMDELQEQLERAVQDCQNGGAVIGIAWRHPSEILCVRTFEEREDWICDFEELTKLKITLTRRTGSSTRTDLELAGMKLLPEERGLHPGAIVFNKQLIVASSGFGAMNEHFSNLIGERINDFDFCSQPLRLVATG